MKKIFIV